MKVRRVLCFTIDEDDLEYKKLVDEIVVQNMTVVLGDVSFNSRKLPAPPEEYQTFPWPWMISIEFVVKIPNACETKRIIKDFSKLLGNPEFSDFKIVCDEVSFPCHKNILASRCDYFSALFNMANCVENKTGCVDIKDISAQTMKALLKFIYQGEASESDLDFDLLIAADKYRFLDLVLQCEDHILSGLSEKSALDILALSTMCPTNRIRDEVTKYIRENNESEYNKNGEDWANFKTGNPPLATAKLLEDFSKLLGNPEFSDFKIVCDKESFPCHKNILASRCDYFSAMFKMANCVENKTGCVDIKDISAQAMKALLKFIYHGEASESDLDVDLIVAADKYRFMELAVQCEDHILNGLSEKSALDILALSTMCPTNRIRDEVTRYIRENNDEEYNKNGEDWANFKTANPPLAIAELLEDVIDTDILAFSTLCPMNIMPDEVRSYIRENVECEFNKNSEDWAKFKTTNPSLAIELLQCIIGLDEEEEEEEEKETKK
jgi:hypothetical protein